MDNEMRAWVGCLACYNSGNLVGEWFDAADAPTDMDAFNEAVSSHKGIDCEELWVFDHEGLPGGEFSPSTAVAWAELFDRIDAPNAAVLLWLDDQGITSPGDVSASEVEDAFCGEWGSFAHYAAELADDLGLLDGLDESLHGYFDMDAWARDLAHDYTTFKVDYTTTYIFRAN